MTVAKDEFVKAGKNVTQAEGTLFDRNVTLNLANRTANNVFGNVSSNASNSASSRSSANGVILLIGDGMSPARITAARWDKARENLATYANTSLNMDHFDYDEFVSTYSANSFTIDSAAAITAIATGLTRASTMAWARTPLPSGRIRRTAPTSPTSPR